MTSTTAALAALNAGEHLVHRPRGVVHLYRGPLTASGRFVPMAGRPECHQRTNRLIVLEPPEAGPLDPAWTRRLCARCERLLSPTPVRVTAADWDAWAAGLTLDDLYANVRSAETPDELDRVVHAGLRPGIGYRVMASVPVGDDQLPLVQQIARQRTAIDTDAAEARAVRGAADRALTSNRARADQHDRLVETEARAADTGNAVDRLRARRARAAFDHQPAAS